MLRRSPGYALTCPPGGRIQATHDSYLAWQRENTVFSDVAAFRATAVDCTVALGEE